MVRLISLVRRRSKKKPMPRCKVRPFCEYQKLQNRLDRAFADTLFSLPILLCNE